MKYDEEASFLDISLRDIPVLIGISKGRATCPQYLNDLYNAPHYVCLAPAYGLLYVAEALGLLSVTEALGFTFRYYNSDFVGI